MLCFYASPDTSEVVSTPPHLRGSVSANALPNFRILRRPNISDDKLYANASPDTSGMVIPPYLFVLYRRVLTYVGIRPQYLPRHGLQCSAESQDSVETHRFGRLAAL